MPPRIIHGAVLLLLAPAAGAVEMSPARTRLAVAPGDHVVRTIRVGNDSDLTLRGTVSLADWTIEGGDVGGIRWHAPGTTALSCGERVEVSPSELLLEPGQRGELEVAITVPDGAQGSCYSAVMAAMTPVFDDAHEPMAMVTTLRMGHLVVVEAEGRTRHDATLDQFEVVSLDDTRPITVALELANTGDGGLRPEGTVALLDAAGATVGMADLPVRFAQPEGRVRLEVPFDAVLGAGTYTAVGVVDIGGGKVLAPSQPFEIVDRVELTGVEAGASGLTLEVANTGHLSRTVTATVEVEGEPPLESKPLLVLPGEALPLAVGLPALPDGTWPLSVTLSGAAPWTGDVTVRDGTATLGQAP